MSLYSGIPFFFGFWGGDRYLGLVEKLYRYTNCAGHNGRLCVMTVLVVCTNEKCWFLLIILMYSINARLILSALLPLSLRYI